MIETPQGTVSPPPKPAPKEILEKIKAVVGERVDDYLVVVSIEGDVYSLYRTKTAAFGMASMVCHDINHDWWLNRSNKI